MARPKKNPLPTEVMTAKDTAAETGKIAADENAQKAAAAVKTAEPVKTEMPEKEDKAAAVVKEIEKEAEKVKKAAEKTAAKAAGTARAAKAETKKVVKKAAQKAEKKAAEVKNTARAAKSVDSSVIIQFNGKNIETKKVTEIAKAKWVESGKKASAIKNIEVYVNVTEGMAYPVINGEAQEGFYCF